MTKILNVLSKTSFAFAAAISLAAISRPASAAISTMTASPTWNMVNPGEADVYYPDNGGVMFTVNSPGATVQVTSLGRFFFGAGTYFNSNGYTGPWPDNAGVRTLALSLVTGLPTPGVTSSGTASVIATTLLDPSTAPIASGTQVTINFSGGAVGGWQYADLATPVNLINGASYILTATQLGANTSSGQEYARPDAGTSLPLSSPFTWNAAVFGFDGSSSFVATGLNFGVDANTGPVNLLFDTVVPEPASAGILALAGVGMLRRNRRGK